LRSLSEIPASQRLPRFRVITLSSQALINVIPDVTRYTKETTKKTIPRLISDIAKPPSWKRQKTIFIPPQKSGFTPDRQAKNIFSSHTPFQFFNKKEAIHIQTSLLTASSKYVKFFLKLNKFLIGPGCLLKKHIFCIFRYFYTKYRFISLIWEKWGHGLKTDFIPKPF